MHKKGVVNSHPQVRFSFGFPNVATALCNEVSELRERIKELLTSKKITDDINEILQVGILP